MHLILLSQLAITELLLMAMPISEALKTLIIFTVSLDGDLDDVVEVAELIADAAHPDTGICGVPIMAHRAIDCTV